MKNELYKLSALDLLSMYQSRETNPLEVSLEIIKQLENKNSQFNAFVCFDKEKILQQAKLSSDRWSSGKVKGILDGVPISIKDLLVTKDYPTRRGSFIESLPITSDKDAPVVKKILEQGGIVLGKTTTPEFCLLGTTWSDLHGITSNPWNEKYTPGGSSGGSGVSLATGSSVIATGTDIGGSIRIPASACGIFGYKPPYGRNPEVPYMNLDYYSHSGPMARSTGDIILMQALTAGIHNQDIASLKLAEPFDYNLNLKGLKIAWSSEFCGFEIEDDIINNLNNALKVLSDLGAVIEKVDLDLSAEVLDATEIYLNSVWGTALANEVLGKEDLITSYSRKYLEHSKERTLNDFIKSNKIAWETYAKFGPMIDKFDVFICPTNAVTGIPANHGYPNLDYEFNGKLRSTKEDGDETMWLTTPFNMMSRLPVMSAPTGFASNNIPTGMQIVGKPYDDNSVFKVSFAYEKSLEWLFDKKNRPSCKLN